MELTSDSTLSVGWGIAFRTPAQVTVLDGPVLQLV